MLVTHLIPALSGSHGHFNNKTTKCFLPVNKNAVNTSAILAELNESINLNGRLDKRSLTIQK
jgi:hypothetical protein